MTHARTHPPTHLDFDFGVHFAEVVQDAVEVELPRADDDVLAALLHLGHRQRVGLVDLTQPVEHLGQLRGVDGLDRHLGRRRTQRSRAEQGTEKSLHCRHAHTRAHTRTHLHGGYGVEFQRSENARSVGAVGMRAK